MLLHQLIKSVGTQFITAGTILCLLTLGSASIGNAQTATLAGAFIEKGFCDNGGGGAVSDQSTEFVGFFINFNAFPVVTMDVVGAFPTIFLSGFAFANSASSGVFGLAGSSVVSNVVVNGKYKIKNFNIASLKGKFTATFNDGVNQCIYQGKFIAK